MTSDFDYKKYSLEQLDNWMHDAMSSGGATPQEIYDVILGVVKENYYTYKHQASQAYELLALLNGNGKDHLSCDKDDPSPECKKSWTSFWENDLMPPWGHSDMEALKYTEEELNAMCDKASSDQEKEKCREYNLREAEYYDKRAKLDMNSSYDDMIAAGYTMTDDGFWIKEEKVNKKKWIIPLEVDGPSGEYFITLPDDLQKLSGIHEGDQVEWIDNKDGSYTMKKV